MRYAVSSREIEYIDPRFVAQLVSERPALYTLSMHTEICESLMHFSVHVRDSPSIGQRPLLKEKGSPP